MPNNYQSIQSGQSELKNYYDDKTSMYEAIRRRRKKRIEEMGIEENDQINRDQVPDPEKS